MIPLATVTAGLDEHVDIPRSAYPVVAKIHLGYSSVGNVLKMIYRAPPVFVQFNDGYVSRIVPGTASNGLICNYIPKMPDQLISFYAGTSQRPICPQTNSFRIHMDECSPVFKDEIRIEFEEMRINSDAPDPGEIES